MPFKTTLHKEGMCRQIKLRKNTASPYASETARTVKLGLHKKVNRREIPSKFKNRDGRYTKCHRAKNCTSQAFPLPSHWESPGTHLAVSRVGLSCPIHAWGVCVCAQPRGTSETLGSDVPQGGPKSVALFQSGLVSPVTLYLHTHTHTHICYSKPVILSR